MLRPLPVLQCSSRHMRASLRLLQLSSELLMPARRHWDQLPGLWVTALRQSPCHPADDRRRLPVGLHRLRQKQPLRPLPLMPPIAGCSLSLTAARPPARMPLPLDAQQAQSLQLQCALPPVLLLLPTPRHGIRCTE